VRLTNIESALLRQSEVPASEPYRKFPVTIEERDCYVRGSVTVEANCLRVERRRAFSKHVPAPVQNLRLVSGRQGNSIFDCGGICPKQADQLWEVIRAGPRKWHAESGTKESRRFAVQANALPFGQVSHCRTGYACRDKMEKAGRSRRTKVHKREESHAQSEFGKLSWFPSRRLPLAAFSQRRTAQNVSKTQIGDADRDYATRATRS